MVQGATLFTENESAQRVLWEAFKAEHSKTYASEAEETTRFGYFVDNLKLADEHQAAAAGSGIDDHSRHGITQYFDLDLRNIETPAIVAPGLDDAAAAESTSKHLRKMPSCNTATTNSLVDWTGTYTTSVKNAGMCLGSGWAFAVASQIESDTKRSHGSNYNYVLSPQQLLSCVTSNNGCSGGSAEAAYNYLVNSGLEPDNNYPFASFFGQSRSCNYNPALGVAKVLSYSSIYSGNEACMARHVQTTGPLSVCVAASNAWFTYSGGIMSLSTCPSGAVNHCVQAVGVYPKSARSGGYWKLRNSAGSFWGENGFIRVAYGVNACSITNNPIYTSTQVDY